MNKLAAAKYFSSSQVPMHRVKQHLRCFQTPLCSQGRAQGKASFCFPITSDLELSHILLLPPGSGLSLLSTPPLMKEPFCALHHLLVTISNSESPLSLQSRSRQGVGSQSSLFPAPFLINPRGFAATDSEVLFAGAAMVTPPCRGGDRVSQGPGGTRAGKSMGLARPCIKRGSTITKLPPSREQTPREQF